MGKEKSILVVDDHRMVCEAIAALVETTGLYKKAIPAYTGEEALDILNREHIAIALVDARMPGLSGIDLAKLMEKDFPQVKVIGMTSFDDNETLVEMLQLNLDGVLLKRSTSGREIRTCLDEVSRGRKYVTGEIQQRIQKSQFGPARQPRTHFAKREIQVIRLLCKGRSSKQIAEILGLKISTIEDYRKAMLKNTNTSSTAGLVAFALRNGLL
ncbi:MAG: response regulator transcription factor [Cyclobacteriaceae bacterium]|nr:response regulator transcription factor [Cyclobacteriaceae bacterium]